MSTKHQAETRFVELMTELFQLDEAESLDFGIYRIIRRHNREVRDFLGEIVVEKEQKTLRGGTLSELLEASFSNADAEEIASDKFRIKELETELSIKPGMSPEEREAHLVSLEKIRHTAQLVTEYRTRIEQMAASSTAVKDRTEVLNRLYQFFARHYQDGDFIVERRYGRDGSRYIRSTGEDTEFHWATEDMYYIKSGDIFTDFPVKLSRGQQFTFTVDPETLQKTRAELKPTDKAHYELDTVTKDEEGGTRVSLKYLKGGQNDKQKEEIVAAVQKGCGGDTAEIKRWLNHFIARNQSDFFIHKRLKEALSEDLDIFIKTEILDADQLLAGGDLPKRIIKVGRIVREVGGRIIAFLAALEEFQKSLWEKKKLVFDTRYVITLDRIEKLAGKEWLDARIDLVVERQRDEWRVLGLGDFADAAACRIEKHADLFNEKSTNYLPLPLDTGNFNENFKWELVESVTKNFDLENSLDGIAIQSDNWQALNTLQEKYSQRAKAIYIDPPYNTDAGPIDYKNGYRNSSWIALMDDRLRLGRRLIEDNGVLCCTIDDYEQKELGLLLERTFGENSVAGVVSIRINPSGRPKPSGFAVSHEYAFFVQNSPGSELERLERNEAQKKRYKEIDENGTYMWELFRKRGSGSERKDRKTMYYPLYVSKTSVRVPLMEWHEESEEWIPKESPKEGELVVFPIDEDKKHRRWRWKHSEVTKKPNSFKATKNSDDTWTIYYKYRPLNSGVLPTTMWTDSKFSATEHGTGVLKKLFKKFDVFSYPKSVFAVEECLKVAGAAEEDSLVIDFFGGSATTAHAVIQMNASQDTSTRFIVVEVNKYFETVTLPRIKKVASSFEWEDGNATAISGPGLFMRVQSLEQYEDTLESLDTDNESEPLLPFDDPAFTLRYRLDRATRHVFSSIDLFTSPFGYKLKRAEGGGEARPRQVDLVESLIYLLGLDVARLYREPRGVVITGHDRRGRSVAVFFRDCAAAESAAWVETKLAAHHADRVFTNDTASLTFEGCERFEAIETVFASQFGR